MWLCMEEYECVWLRGSMEVAATEHKVSLSIHKWGVDFWMTSFASVFLPLFTFAWHLGNAPLPCHTGSALSFKQTCIRVYMICHKNVKVKAAHLNTAKYGWKTNKQKNRMRIRDFFTPMWVAKGSEVMYSTSNFPLLYICVPYKYMCGVVCSVFIPAFACLYILSLILLYIVCLCVHVQVRWKDTTCRVVAATTRKQRCCVEWAGLL